jgi:hypothetical protein
MAGCNIPLVRRSAYLFSSAPGNVAYSAPGTPFRYEERMKTRSLVAAILASIGPLFAILLLLPFVRTLVRRILPAPGTVGGDVPFAARFLFGAPVALC